MDYSEDHQIQVLRAAGEVYDAIPDDTIRTDASEEKADSYCKAIVMKLFPDMVWR